MRNSTLKRYAPFIVLLMGQALLVVASPSNGAANRSPLTGLSAEGFQSRSGTAADTGTAVDATGSSAEKAAVGKGATGASNRGGYVISDPHVAPGDTTHCKNGQQSDVTYYAPPCVPKFSGDNGGATYPGVTAKEILVVDFRCQSNDQADAVVASQGLAATEEEQAAIRRAATKYINDKYELYGRKMVVKEVVGDCPVTPPDQAKARQAAEEVAKMKPFIVYDLAIGPSTHDVWARHGIISIGGAWENEAFYKDRRPFRYDFQMSGTQTADSIIEYYCKKMANHPATNAGTVIHPTIPGGRNAPRHLGIVSLDNGENVYIPQAQRIKAAVEKCGNDKDIPIFTYDPDITRATEISRTIVAGLIQAKVTTIICNCEPVGPVFFTQDMTKNQYFPEHVITGAGLLDFEKLARLYDKQQWPHAFGLSQATQPMPTAQTEVGRVWAYAGESGSPCPTCEQRWEYFNLMGDMLQAAGPNLNPLSVERGMFAMPPIGGWARSGGLNTRFLLQYGPGDYNGVSDFREVYWSNTEVSAADGQYGTYVNMNGGRRYGLGELPAGLTVPPYPS